MSSENPYITGNIVVGGRYCEHCSAFGIECGEGGFLLSDAPVGKLTVNIDSISSVIIEGRLKNCKIASGQTPQKEGTVHIKAELERAIKESLNNTGGSSEVSVEVTHNWS